MKHLEHKYTEYTIKIGTFTYLVAYHAETAKQRYGRTNFWYSYSHAYSCTIFTRKCLPQTPTGYYATGLAYWLHAIHS